RGRKMVDQQEDACIVQSPEQMPKSSSNKVFRGQNQTQEIETNNQACKIVRPPPSFTLPFPPEINAEDLINSKTRKLPSKPPNAFFIYRKVYTKELIARDFRYKMTDVSPWVSSSWKNESDKVREKYKEIAKGVRQLYKQSKLENTEERMVENKTQIHDPQPSPLPSTPFTIPNPESPQETPFNQLNNRFNDQLNNRFNDQLNNRLNDQLNNRLNDQLNNRLNDQLNNRLNDQLNNRLNDQLNQEQTCIQNYRQIEFSPISETSELDHNINININSQALQMTNIIDGLEIEPYNEYFGITFQPPYTPYYNGQITTEPYGLDLFLENSHVEWDLGENEFPSY
ncbi:35122_t:CDS:2, partial [Racocetra persica]